MKPERISGTEIEKYFESRGVKTTAMRLLIYKAMTQYMEAFSLADLEASLGTVDKSTLSRTINLFHEHRVIHSIDDGSGTMKYSVCSMDCNCELQDLHVHFYCTRCNRTLCLHSVAIPKVRMPLGFVPESENFVIKGICNLCSARSGL